MNRIYVHSVVLYQKYLTRLGEMIIFSPRLENYQFFKPLGTICFFSLVVSSTDSVTRLFNSFPNDRILDWSNLRAFADDILKVARILIFVFGRVRNIMGKGEIAGYQHFLLFHNVFKTLLSHGR